MSFETNEYFDGNVKSIAFNSETLPATVGVMEVGEYTFTTNAIEHMTVVSGCLTVKFENEAEFNQGETFIVAADSASMSGLRFKRHIYAFTKNKPIDICLGFRCGSLNRVAFLNRPCHFSYSI